jgi:tetratricopeptide (TPR) repeat protein
MRLNELKVKAPDSHHLNAAQGWLGLGNHLEANEELEKITPNYMSHPHVLAVNWEIPAKAKKWEGCVEIAQAIIKLAPDQPQAWIHRSFALHELGRPGAALDLLLPAAKRFPSVWTIPYNLASYCAQTGRLDECEEWFKKAMQIDEHTVKRAGIEDPDLEPLWKSMRGSKWKRVE